MLKVMRDSFHQLKWILLAVVAAFVFGFVFIDMGLGGGGFGGATDSRSFAARVNGETITYNDYYRALKNLQDMYQQMYGQQFTPEMAEQMGLPQQVLNSLIDQRLLVQEAERLNLEASPEEVRKKLLSIPTFSPEGKFVGMDLYTRYVTGPLGYASAADFEEDLAREIALGKIDSALMNSVIVSPKTADAEYRRANENAKIKYVLLPAAQHAASVSVTPADVETYYKNNQSKFTHGEQRQIRYLLADYGKLSQQITPTDDELRRRYEANKESYRQPAAARVLHILVKSDPTTTPQADAAARAKAESIVQQLRAGADFATLARANSEDPSSSATGGDMGWVDKGKTVEVFERAIFSIPLNTISDPIRSQEFGYHIVKVTERRAEGIRSFEQVRPQLTMQVANEMARDVARSEINRIHALIKQNKPATVEAFVALSNDKVTSNDSGWFGRNEPIGALGSHEPLAQWAFAAKKGEVGEPLGTPRGIAIAYLVDTRQAGMLPLGEVRPRVEQEARMAKAREAARVALQQMMAGATSIDAVSQKAAVPANETTVTRQGGVPGFSGDTAQLVEASIAAKVGDVKGPIIVGDGAVAFQVVEQKKVTAEELVKNRASFIDSLRGQQARALRTALLQRLRKAADVEVNDQITRPTTQPAGV